MALRSSFSGSPSENTRRPSSLRSTQEITTTRCRCGGRKSLPLCVRRFWNATSATSCSGSSCGRPCSRRMPSTSGMVSISKARTGLIGEDSGAEVAVAAVADDADDHRVPQFLRDANGDVHRAAGGDPGEDALLAREAPRHFLRLALAHLLDAIHPRALVDLRQVGLRPLADARDLRAFHRLAADDLDLRVLLLEEARAAHDGAGGAHARDEVRDPAAGVAPDLGAGRLVVG